MPRIDLAFAQKVLYGNCEVFVVPPTASYWLEWQEGLQAAVELHPQRLNHWNWAVHGAASQGPSTLALLAWWSLLKAKICISVYGCQYCSFQLSVLMKAIPSTMTAADDGVIDGTVHVEHLLLQSNPNSFFSHSPTYLTLSTMKYHIH